MVTPLLRRSACNLKMRKSASIDIGLRTLLLQQLTPKCPITFRHKKTSTQYGLKGGSVGC